MAQMSPMQSDRINSRRSKLNVNRIIQVIEDAIDRSISTESEASEVFA
jgi:hypothetical protein